MTGVIGDVPCTGTLTFTGTGLHQWKTGASSARPLHSASNVPQGEGVGGGGKCERVPPPPSPPPTANAHRQRSRSFAEAANEWQWYEGTYGESSGPYRTNAPIASRESAPLGCCVVQDHSIPQWPFSLAHLGCSMHPLRLPRRRNVSGRSCLRSQPLGSPVQETSTEFMSGATAVRPGR